MGDKSNKQHNSAEEEPVFYDESGGVTKAEAIKMIQGLHFSPDQSPMGVEVARQIFMPCRVTISIILSSLSKQ